MVAEDNLFQDFRLILSELDLGGFLAKVYVDLLLLADFKLLDRLGPRSRWGLLLSWCGLCGQRWLLLGGLFGALQGLLIKWIDSLNLN